MCALAVSTTATTTAIRRPSMFGLSFAVAVEFRVDGTAVRGETLELKEGTAFVTSAAAKHQTTRFENVRRIELPASINTIERLDTLDGVIIRECLTVKKARGKCAFFHVNGDVMLQCVAMHGHMTIGRAGRIATISGNIFSGQAKPDDVARVPVDQRRQRVPPPGTPLLPHQVELVAPSVEINYLQMRESDVSRRSGHTGSGVFVLDSAVDVELNHCDDLVVKGMAMDSATNTAPVRVVSGYADKAGSLSGEIVLERCPAGAATSRTGRVYVRESPLCANQINISTTFTFLPDLFSAKPPAAAAKANKATKRSASKAAPNLKRKTPAPAAAHSQKPKRLAIMAPGDASKRSSPPPLPPVSKAKPHFQIELVD